MCDTWPDHIYDVGGCRTQGGVDKHTMQLLSFIPYTGISSFYSKKHFHGVVELLHGFFAIILGCFASHAHKGSSTDAEAIATFFIVSLAILNFMKLIISSTKTEFGFEVVIMLVSLVQSFDDLNNEHHVTKALHFTGRMGLGHAIKHVVLVLINMEVDGSGCPFI